MIVVDFVVFLKKFVILITFFYEYRSFDVIVVLYFIRRNDDYDDDKK